MAGSSSSFKNRNVSATFHQNKASKTSNFLCKFFIIILVLLLLPLIPSQAPDFITQSSIFTMLWELFHLMFIGVAVCYGLFSKRSSSNVELVNHPRSDANSQAFLNGILDVSSFFEDGLENVCGCNEKKLILQNSLLGNKRRSLLCENGASSSSDIDGDMVTKTWNSMYSRSKSMVVVANGECVVDEWGKPISMVEHKHLNLPVRSLRSRVKGVNKPEENKTLESSLSSVDCSENDAKKEVGKIRGMVHISLENKFEKVAEPAPIRWRWRSGKRDTREEISKANPTSQSRPHSFGKSDFEVMVSRFTWQSKSSITISNASSAPELSPLCMKMKNLERRNDVTGSSGTVVEPAINGEPPFVASKSTKMENLERKKNARVSSSVFEEPGINAAAPFIASKSMKMDNLGSRKDLRFSSGSEKKIWSFFEPDLESPCPVKVLSRGKSVRTFRSSKFVLDEVKMKEKNSCFIDDNAGEMNNEIDDASFVNGVGEKIENSQVSAEKPTFSDIQSEDEQDFLGSCSETSKETTSAKASQSDSFKVRSDDEVESDVEGSEVDRKAGEFIAKFREQIRLQKLASIKRYRE